jgi:RHS repeat-associated protein
VVRAAPDRRPGPRRQDAAAKTAAHAATPAIAHGDALGRTFLTIAHNRFTPSGAAPSAPPVEERYATRVVLDIEGNPREIRDAAGRAVMRYDYDLRGACIHDAAMEAGERWMLTDVAGALIHAHDGRGFHVRSEYDALRRPLRTFVQGLDAEAPAAERLVARTEYGEGQPDDVRFNLRTRPYRQYDAAGVVTNAACDFKGNLVQSQRQLARSYKDLPDWAASPALEPEAFTSSTAYDALDRVVAVTSSDASVYHLAFNDAGRLERVQVQLRGAQAATTFVGNIDYDARGRRTRIDYGNGVSTAYTYDPATQRLTRLVTTRPGQAVLQDLRYAYDAVGNVTRIRDAAQQTTYFNNQIVSPDSGYVYDAAYRLIGADGREHVGQASQPQTTWNDASRINLPQPGDGQAMRRYQESYRYDEVGNLLELAHQAASGNWTRAYSYGAASQLEPGKHGNRLTSTTVGGATEAYDYDAHGNITAMPHLTVLAWDFRNQLGATARQAVSSGTPETTYYVYNAGGQRVRKVTERQNGTRRNERIYLGGLEIYREYDGAGAAITLARETLHVADDQQRIARVETRTAGDEPGVPPQRVRYQLGNHLGSVALELDDQAQVISYEEYYPHGGTSYQAVRGATEVNRKRYRYTGMERDDETGFNYHAARYYAPWLGRWISPDPQGVGNDGTNVYAYARNNPVRLTDPSGFDSEKGQFQWAQSKDENDRRHWRLTHVVRPFLIEHGIRRDDIRDYLDKYGDREILEHYGYVENDRRGDEAREDNQRRIIEAINQYEDDYLGRAPGQASMSAVTPAQTQALQKAQAQAQFYRLWLEGWQYVTSSFTAAASAWTMSKFTDDQQKITGAAGAGYAAAGAASPAAQVVAARIQAARGSGGSRGGKGDPPTTGGGGGDRRRWHRWHRWRGHRRQPAADRRRSVAQP